MELLRKQLKEYYQVVHEVTEDVNYYKYSIVYDIKRPNDKKYNFDENEFVLIRYFESRIKAYDYMNELEKEIRQDYYDDYDDYIDSEVY